MKVVLIFLHVPVFSSEGWLSTIKVKLKGEKTIETVSSIPVLKKTLENEIEAMHNSRYE